MRLLLVLTVSLTLSLIGPARGQDIRTQAKFGRIRVLPEVAYDTKVVGNATQLSAIHQKLGGRVTLEVGKEVKVFAGENCLRVALPEHLGRGEITRCGFEVKEDTTLDVRLPAFQIAWKPDSSYFSVGPRIWAAICLGLPAELCQAAVRLNPHNPDRYSVFPFALADGKAAKTFARVLFLTFPTTLTTVYVGVAGATATVQPLTTYARTAKVASGLTSVDVSFPETRIRLRVAKEPLKLGSITATTVDRQHWAQKIYPFERGIVALENKSTKTISDYLWLEDSSVLTLPLLDGFRVTMTYNGIRKVFSGMTPGNVVNERLDSLNVFPVNETSTTSVFRVSVKEADGTWRPVLPAATQTIDPHSPLQALAPPHEFLLLPRGMPEGSERSFARDKVYFVTPGSVRVPTGLKYRVEVYEQDDQRNIKKVNDVIIDKT